MGDGSPGLRDCLLELTDEALARAFLAWCNAPESGMPKGLHEALEKTGIVERVSELHACLPESFTILSGDDSLTLPFLSLGAVGVVSVASNIFPAEVCSLVHAYQTGDVKSAKRLHRKMFPLFKDLFIEPNPVPIKTALSWHGVMSSEVRLPLCEMSESNQARLRKTLDGFEREK